MALRQERSEVVGTVIVWIDTDKDDKEIAIAKAVLNVEIAANSHSKHRLHLFLPEKDDVKEKVNAESI